MASIVKEIAIAAKPDAVWDAVRDYGAVHRRLAPGFVTDTKLDGDHRIVTFANGMVLRELIVSVDEVSRRLVWAAVGDAIKHHNGSLQVLADGAGTRLVWTTDILPDERVEIVEPVMAQGMKVMKRTLEAGA